MEPVPIVLLEKGREASLGFFQRLIRGPIDFFAFEDAKQTFRVGIV